MQIRHNFEVGNNSVKASKAFGRNAALDETAVFEQLQKSKLRSTQSVSDAIAVSDNFPKEVPAENKNSREIVSKNIKSEDSFTKQGTDKSSYKFSTAQKLLIGGGGAVIAVCARKKLAACGSKIINGIKNVWKGTKLPLKSTEWHSEIGETTTEAQKNIFIEKFIEPLKKGKTPGNGFLIEGAESKGKKQFFDWMIKKVEEQGVEVVDTTDKATGGPTWVKVSEATDTLFATKRKPTDKFKLLVIRGLEKLGIDDVSGRLRGELHDSAKNNGVILAYDCKSSKNFHDAVTRPGRIDFKATAQPLSDESTELWKQYLKKVENDQPAWAAKEFKEAEEVFKKRGGKDYEEMKPHLTYTPPYEIPSTGARTALWQEYAQKTTEKINQQRQFHEFALAVDVTANDYVKGKISKKKYQEIIDVIMQKIPEAQRARMKELIDASIKIHSK